MYTRRDTDWEKVLRPDGLIKGDKMLNCLLKFLTSTCQLQ
jgi:hypothetical protein